MDLALCSEEELAAAVARESSDGPAFVALVDRFRQRVWRICFVCWATSRMPNDTAQEVFLQLFLHRGRFPAGRNTPPGCMVWRCGRV